MKDFEQTQFPGEKSSDMHEDSIKKQQAMKQYFDREGPQQRTIPERTFTTCSGCKYLSHHMIHSGRNPQYADSCEHPGVLKDHAIGFFNGNLHKNLYGIIETPRWCPFLKNKPDENENSQTTEGIK